MDPITGNVICSINVPPVSPTNLSFGRCLNSNDKRLICIYLTSLKQGLTSPTIDDGAFFVIEGVEAEGLPPYEVDYDRVFNSKPNKCN